MYYQHDESKYSINLQFSQRSIWQHKNKSERLTDENRLGVRICS